jgi:hypothetical protein
MNWHNFKKERVAFFSEEQIATTLNTLVRK